MNPVREHKRDSNLDVETILQRGQPRGFSNRVKRFFGSLFGQHVFTFLLLILIASGLVTYFFPASLQPSPQAQLGDRLNCNTAKASERLRQAQIVQADSLKLVISFRQPPTTAQVSDYADQGVILYPDSWVFDYLIGETSYQGVCNLLSDQAVTYVDLLIS